MERKLCENQPGSRYPDLAAMKCGRLKGHDGACFFLCAAERVLQEQALISQPQGTLYDDLGPTPKTGYEV